MGGFGGGGVKFRREGGRAVGFGGGGVNLSGRVVVWLVG